MRVAIIGGGIAGLTAAWELTRSSRAGTPIQTTLFESSNRLGGIVETVREGGFVIETGPDAWLTAKPWASKLAADLGVADELISSNDATRRTWIALRTPNRPARLVPMPDGMTLMVPRDLDALTGSPLFSAAAIQAYRAEPIRAAELLASIPPHDESVADFTLRHFGSEVLHRVAAPLLSGVFGGDVHTLSARASLPALIQMERTHGSLITALQSQRSARNGLSPTTAGQAAEQAAEAPALFTTLRTGLGTLIDRLTAEISHSIVRFNSSVTALTRRPSHGGLTWDVTSTTASGRSTTESFDRVFLALPAAAARQLLVPLDARAASLLPAESSSAVLVAFAFTDATRVPVPPGFGLLVPPISTPFPFAGAADRSDATDDSASPTETPTLLQACTFADQKFSSRVPAGGRLLRAYFSGAAAARLSPCNNDEIAAIARLELARVLHTYTHATAPLTGPTPTPLPDPLITVVRRLPASLPQYAVGHLDRVAELHSRLSEHLPALTLLGNSLHGLGIPDVIRDARNAARHITETA